MKHFTNRGLGVVVHVGPTDSFARGFNGPKDPSSTLEGSNLFCSFIYNIYV